MSQESPASTAVADGFDRSRGTTRLALGVSALALLATVSAPWWQPVVFDNDIATRQAAILATVQIKQLASTDDPFVSQLTLLARALPQDEATTEVLSSIAPLAANGVPTVEQLSRGFRGTADQVLVGRLVEKDDQSWFNWGVHKLAALVMIDTLSEKVMAPPADVVVVHDAEAAIQAKDLPRAVDILSQLEGTSGRIVEEWLSDARDRVALDKAVGDLAEQVQKRAESNAWLRFTEAVSRWVESKLSKSDS